VGESVGLVYALRDVPIDADFGDKCDERSFNAVLNPLPRRSIAALSFYKRAWKKERRALVVEVREVNRRSIGSAFGELRVVTSHNVRRLDSTGIALHPPVITQSFPNSCHFGRNSIDKMVQELQHLF
jgi:hypothetical protein